MLALLCLSDSCIKILWSTYMATFCKSSKFQALCRNTFLLTIITLFRCWQLSLYLFNMYIFVSSLLSYFSTHLWLLFFSSCRMYCCTTFLAHHLWKISGGWYINIWRNKIYWESEFWLESWTKVGLKLYLYITSYLCLK